MRITTNMSMRNYQNGLGRALSNQDLARTRVMTKRNFNKMSEDPSAALKAFRLRKDYAKTDDYLETLKTAQSELNSVESSEQQIKKIIDQAISDVARGVGSPMDQSQKNIIAEELRGLQKSILLSANAKFGDKFLFGGANTSDVPFELDANGVLTYRGVDVTTLQPNDPLINEKLYIDIGFGLEVDWNNGTPTVTDSTAYNAAISGANLLGYGPNDGDGASPNIVLLLGQIATNLEDPNFTSQQMQPFQDKLAELGNNTLNNLTNLGTNSTFLEDTEKRLDDNLANINTAIVDIEDVDMAGAITEYMWAQYAYNAALKVGNSLLSTSFIDFMR